MRLTKTKPLKLRLFCELCGTIFKMNLFRGDKGLALPICCKKEMLIAGEPKRDYFGLRKSGAIIDPIEEYYKHKVPSDRKRSIAS